MVEKVATISRHHRRNFAKKGVAAERTTWLVLFVAMAATRSICSVVNANKTLSRCNGPINFGVRRKSSRACFVNPCRAHNLCSTQVQSPWLSITTWNSESSTSRSSLHMNMSSTRSSSTQTQPAQPKSQSNKPTPENPSPKKQKLPPSTGLLRQLPPLQPHNEILSRALRQTHNNIRDDPKVANIKRRTQKRGAQSIDFLQQALFRPLRETVDTYKRCIGTCTLSNGL